MRLMISIISLLFVSCNTHHYATGGLQLGKPIPASAKPIDTSAFGNMILFRPNEFRPSKIIDYNGVVYNVCIDPSRNVIFIFTNDKNFLSSDGYKIGDTFLKLNGSLSVVNKTVIPGYGVEVLLPSEWKATFLDQPTLQNGHLSDTSTIKSFYKRLE